MDARLANADTCQACKCVLGDTRIGLSRQTERTLPLSPSTIETTVRESEELETFCLECEAIAVLASFERLGLQAVHTVADPPVLLCSRCHGTYIDEEQWHIAYIAELYRIDGDELEILGDLFYASVCRHCECPDAEANHR